MMFVKLWVLFNLLALSVALARAQEQPPSPHERALMERVSREINSNLICSTNLEALRDKIKELEAKLKEAPK